jgi:hypothetical protein
MLSNIAGKPYLLASAPRLTLWGGTKSNDVMAC